MTLDELLSPRNRATLETMLMAVLQEAPIEGMPAGGFPVTDWQPGGFERTHMKMIATGLLDREDTIRMLTASGFLELAATLVDADGNPIEGWMELLASQNYGVTRNDAGYTRQTLTLTCTTGPGPYTVGAGELIALAPATGNRYLNVDEVTIPDGGSVVATFQAEGPGVGYIDSTGSIIEIVAPALPGVTVTNSATAAGVPTAFITGSGSIEVTSTGVTTSPRTVKLLFVSPGRVDDNSAQFTCTVYQGTSVTTTGPFTAGATFSQGDLDLAINDGGAGTQSFSVGDVWVVGVPGTPIIQAGTDKETLAALAQRCLDQWAMLSAIPIANRYAALVRQCETENHIGITKVMTEASSTVAGVENITIAGPTSTASPDQVSVVQNYIDQRSGEIDIGNVLAAEAYPITVGGTVSCRRGTLTAVQDAADLAWARYIAALDIGGEKPTGIVKLLALENVINDAGAFNATGLELNGTAADVVLTALQCATVDSEGLPSQAMTWREIS